MPGKSLKMNRAPADPSVPPVAVQASGTMLASTVIGTGLSSSAAQRSAARWKTINRCWPSVVPVFPPTGATGVGSLRPTPGRLLLTSTIVELANAG